MGKEHEEYPPWPVQGIPVSAPPAPPGAFQVQQLQAANVQWSTGLCDCFDDVPICCITCWCPCITFGQVAEIVDRGSTSCGVSGALYGLLLYLTGCQWIYSCFYRTKMRAQYGLAEGPCADCLVHFCCESCAICQEYRELRNRGYDMNLGWQQGNVEGQQLAGGGRPNLPPPMQGGMTR